jgi:hypothetical protein
MDNTNHTLLPAAALFHDPLTDARANQFRMRRLQVYNWGTFSGLTDIPIAERGFLFVGRSGSGKSTHPAEHRRLQRRRARSRAFGP